MDQGRMGRTAMRIGIGLSTVGLLVALSALFLPFAGSASATAASGGTPSGGSACQPANVITAYHFSINGKTVTTLHNNVQQGDSVEAFFTIHKGCDNIPVGLVSHTMPDSTFVPSHASQQKVFDSAKGSFNAGDDILGPINVPGCNFQIDFAALGYQGQPGFTYSSAVGGTTVCSGSPPAPVTTMCTTGNNVGVTLYPMSPPASETYTVTIVANGQTTTDTITVIDTPLTHNYVVPEDTSATVTVTNSSGETVYSQTVPHDCARPSASVSHECVIGTTGGIQVQATNEGSQPKMFTILRNGTAVATLTVAPFSNGGTTVAMAEGETATWSVTGPEGLATTPLSVINSCTQVLPIVITTPTPASNAPGSGPGALGTNGTLPLTGVRSDWVIAAAMALMAVGGLITVAAKRSLRSTGSR